MMLQVVAGQISEASTKEGLGRDSQGSLFFTNPNFMHYKWEIPQNYHTFALLDPPPNGSHLMIPDSRA